MIEFAIAFSLGAGYTLLMIGLVMSFVRREEDKKGSSDNFNLFVTKDEFDMLCRVVHDMARDKDRSDAA